MTCGSVWTCPVCAANICARRAAEVKAAVERWNEANETHRVAMLTLTVRHARGHDLERLRRGLARAWRKVWMGKAGQARRWRWGVSHQIRALEVTHGENGWHPHLHVALFQTRETTPEQVDAIRELWAKLVTKELGSDCAPSWERGVDYRALNTTNYLTKLGLEVASMTEKKGRGASRTPWQIAADAAAGDRRSIALWLEYTKAMKGARQLFWSQGARRFFGLVREESEHEMSQDGPGYVLGEWDGAVWDALCRADRFWVSKVAAAASTFPGAAAAVGRLEGVRFLSSGAIGPPLYTWPLSPVCHSESTTGSVALM